MKKLCILLTALSLLFVCSCQRAEKQEEGALEKFTKSSKELQKTADQMKADLDSTYSTISKKQPVN